MLLIIVRLLLLFKAGEPCGDDRSMVFRAVAPPPPPPSGSEDVVTLPGVVEIKLVVYAPSHVQVNADQHRLGSRVYCRPSDYKGFIRGGRVWYCVEAHHAQYLRGTRIN